MRKIACFRWILIAVLDRAASARSLARPVWSSDRIGALFRLGQSCQAQIDGADALVRDTMSAYSAGVNAYIESQPLPPEFALLRYKPESWGLADAAAIGAVMAWGLSVNWET